MFETMRSFLTFFFPTLAAILLGIIFEDELIAFERAVGKYIKKRIYKFIHPQRNRKENRIWATR